MSQHASASTSITSLVARIADEYLDQLALGAVPDLAEYARRYPQVASVLPQVLPALRIIHELVPDTPSPAVQPADLEVLDDYRIKSELGRGGMGVVYEAEQMSLGRRVALKVLPPACGIGTKQLARFQIEAQVAAALHHPHIVPIFAVGCVGGVHYYAMQLIEGNSLAELLAGSNRHAGGDEDIDRLASGKSAARSPTRLLPREAARLAMQAALALEHAHGLGVLHRDIKPANLLVDHSGHLWVTDFGLAGVGGGGDLTLSGDLIGTLRYMSPEQAAGGRVLDPRTDLYSLGATLYELLTSRPAFDGRDRQELLHQIAVNEPIAPRKLDGSIPRDLETIVEKAMAKEPQRRYSTARELADDLGRYLDDRPVLARRPSLAERAARWLSRHRKASATAAAMVVLAGLASAVGTAQLWRAHQKTRLALQAAQVARDNEREAVLVTFAASDQIAQRALLLIAAPKPAQSTVEADHDREFCRRAVAYYAEIARRYDRDPEMQPIAAAAYHRVGFIRMILEDHDAEDALHQSITLYEKLVARLPMSVDLRCQLALTYDDLVLLLRTSGRLTSNLDWLRKLVALREGLAVDLPAPNLCRVSLTYNLAELRDLLEAAGRTLEAEEVRRRLEDNYNLILQDEPDNSRACDNLAWLLASPAEAPVCNTTRAVELAERAVAHAATDGVYWKTLGLARYRAGEWKAAAKALEESARLRSGGDASLWLLLAMARWQLGDHTQAKQYYDRSDEWINKYARQNRELSRFRAEAARLTGLETSAAARATR
jgi:eukaryotic-like serine/threonine-protein kinase